MVWSRRLQTKRQMIRWMHRLIGHALPPENRAIRFKENQVHVAHYNVARLRELPGHPSVAEFIDNVPKVNAVAERSPGFVWRLDDANASVSGVETFQAVTGDPYLAISLSVWENPDALLGFVRKTVHGAFLRRRVEWFVPWPGPNYVIWPVPVGHIPSLKEGEARLMQLAASGADPSAFDFKYFSANS